MASKRDQIDRITKQLDSVKSQTKAKQQELEKVEKSLYEKEFLLSDLEAEKQVKTADARL